MLLVVRVVVQAHRDVLRLDRPIMTVNDLLHDRGETGTGPHLQVECYSRRLVSVLNYLVLSLTQLIDVGRGRQLDHDVDLRVGELGVNILGC